MSIVEGDIGDAQYRNTVRKIGKYRNTDTAFMIGHAAKRCIFPASRGLLRRGEFTNYLVVRDLQQGTLYPSRVFVYLKHVELFRVRLSGKMCT